MIQCLTNVVLSKFFSLRTIKWIKRMFFMLKNTYSVIILHFTIYDNTKFVGNYSANAIA